MIFGTAGVFNHSIIHGPIGADGWRRRGIDGKDRIVPRLRILEPYSSDRRERTAVESEEVSRSAIADTDVNCLEIGAEGGRTIHHHSGHALIGCGGGHRYPGRLALRVDASDAVAQFPVVSVAQVRDRVALHQEAKVNVAGGIRAERSIDHDVRVIRLPMLAIILHPEEGELPRAIAGAGTCRVRIVAKIHGPADSRKIEPRS